MASQINFNLLLSETDISAMVDWPPALVSDYANISRTINAVLDSVALKGMVFSFTGSGATNPTLGTSFNITSLTRVSPGLYRAVYKDKILNGTDITKDSVKHAGYFFNNVNDHAVEIRSTVAGSFDILTWQTNTGNKVAYDLVAGDEVSVSILLNREAEISL